jgi:hypothetical protein
MKLTINSFKTAIRTIGEKTKEPVFETTGDYSCEIVDDAYIVKVYNVTPEHLEELKNTYQWLSEEEINTEEIPNV